MLQYNYRKEREHLYIEKNANFAPRENFPPYGIIIVPCGAVYSRVCGWERGSSCLWDFYSETTVVERRSRGVAAGMTSNVLSSSSFIDTARRIT